MAIPTEIEPTDPTAPARRKKWVAAITLIVGGMGALAFWAIGTPNAVAYYKTPSELSAIETGAQRVRVGGRLVDGSLERKGKLTSFTITDGRQEVAVQYVGEVPDTLRDGSDVIAEGHTTREGLAADRVLAKCSSKFVPKDKPEHLGRT